MAELVETPRARRNAPYPLCSIPAQDAADVHAVIFRKTLHRTTAWLATAGRVAPASTSTCRGATRKIVQPQPEAGNIASIPVCLNCLGYRSKTSAYFCVCFPHRALIQSQRAGKFFYVCRCEQHPGRPLTRLVRTEIYNQPMQSAGSDLRAAYPVQFPGTSYGQVPGLEIVLALIGSRRKRRCPVSRNVISIPSSRCQPRKAPSAGRVGRPKSRPP